MGVGYCGVDSVGPMSNAKAETESMAARIKKSTLAGANKSRKKERAEVKSQKLGATNHAWVQDVPMYQVAQAEATVEANAILFVLPRGIIIATK